MIFRRKRRASYEMDMTNGNLLPMIVSFSFSLILTNVLQLLYNAADLIVVGQFSSTPGAVGAIGATGALTNLIVNLFIGLSVGVSVLTARGCGKADRAFVERVVHTSVTVALLSGLFITVFGLLFSEKILTMMGTSEAILGRSVLYLSIYFIGSPFNMVYNFGASILRATGDTKRPFYFLAISGLANVLLNLVFVCIFHMDVAGVAIATVASQVISAVLVVLCLTRQQGACRLNLKKLRVDGAVMKEMIRIGLPASIQSCIFSISNVLIQSSINSFDIPFIAEGRAPYATGSAAAASIEAFVLMSMSALYQAALNFTGQNSAAGKYRRVRRILWQCLGCVTVVGIVMGGICILFGKSLIAIYTPGDAEAIAVGYRRMLLLCSMYFLCGIMDVTVGQLRGLGRSFVPMCVSIVGICVLRVFWIYTIFAAHHTWEMLIISYPVTWVLTGAAQFVCYYFIQKKLPKEDAPTQAAPALR